MKQKQMERLTSHPHRVHDKEQEMVLYLLSGAAIVSSKNV